MAVKPASGTVLQRYSCSETDLTICRRRRRFSACGNHLKGKMFMRKFFATAILAAAAAMFISPAPVSAGNIECLTIDNNISFASPKLTDGDYEMNCVLTANQSIEVAENKESFKLISGNYSFYKVNMQTLRPSAFAASGEQLCTVLETKFTVTLQDDTVDDYIPTFTYGMQVTAGSSVFAGEGESQKRTLPVDGGEYTIKYVINPVTKEITEFRNDELITTTAFAALGENDISQIKFYPRPLAGKNADGEYMKSGNNKTVLDYGDDDGNVALATPIIWDFDYIKVYQISPYGIGSSDPTDGSFGASVSGPYTVSFDCDMDTDTINDTSVEMTNEATGEKLTAIPMMFEPNVCTVYPAGLVEYFTRYSLTFLSSVKDQYGFSNAAPVGIEFTTEKRPIIESVVYADADAPVTLSCGAALEEGTVTGEMKLKSAAEGQEVRVIAALYNKSDTGYMFVGKAEKTVTLPAGETAVTLPEITVADKEQQIIKYMVWDSANYPLTDAVVCDGTHVGI